MQGQGSPATVEVRNIPQYLNQDDFSRHFGQLQGCQGCAIRMIGSEPVGFVTFINSACASTACQTYNGWQGWGPKGLSVQMQHNTFQPAPSAAARAQPAYPTRPPQKRDPDPNPEVMGNNQAHKHQRFSMLSQPTAPVAPPATYQRDGQAAPHPTQIPPRSYGQHPSEPNPNPMQHPNTIQQQQQQPPQQQQPQYAPTPYIPQYHNQQDIHQQQQQQQQLPPQSYQQPPQQYPYGQVQAQQVGGGGRPDPALAGREVRAGMPPIAPPNPLIPSPVMPPNAGAPLNQQQQTAMMAGGGMMQQAVPKVNDSPVVGQAGAGVYGARYAGMQGMAQPVSQDYKSAAPGMGVARNAYMPPPQQPQLPQPQQQPPPQLDGRQERGGMMQQVPGMPGMSPVLAGGRGGVAAYGTGMVGEGVGGSIQAVEVHGRGGQRGAPEQYVPEAKAAVKKDLPRDATDTLFVEGFPPDISKREVSHIFRPFQGFATVRLISKGTVSEPTVLCFVRFDSPSNAHVALTTLQGYPMDMETESTSLLKLSFARQRVERGRPYAQRGGGRTGGRGRMGEGGGRGGGRKSMNDGAGAVEQRTSAPFFASTPTPAGRGNGGWMDDRRARPGFMPQGRGGYYMP